MKLDDKKKTLAKRILAGVLALVVLGLGICVSYHLTKGYGEAATPTSTPDNSQFVDPSVEYPDDSKTPNEMMVNTAFILIEAILIALIVYVLLRKKVG